MCLCSLEELMTEQLRLENLLPHEPPMLLLSSVVSVDENGSCCEAYVARELPFVDDNGDLPGWVGIELMAQTIGVWGARHAENAGHDVNIGLLLGSRKYESQVGVFPAGSRLIVTAEKVLLDGNMGVFQCAIHLDDKIVANAQVNTYLPGKEELQQILERDF